MSVYKAFCCNDQKALRLCSFDSNELLIKRQQNQSQHQSCQDCEQGIFLSNTSLFR